MTQSCDAHVRANACILVAEDDPIAQAVVKRILDQAGYQSDFVGDGRAAIMALESKNYDLVLMDCLMPRMDGFAATRLIRGSDSVEIDAGIPIIALTGLSDGDDHAECLEAGMNSMINKPVEAESLIAEIGQCLGSPEVEQSTALLDATRSSQTFDDGFLNTILDKFLAEVPGVIGNLQSAMALQDPVKLQNIAHRLKGVTDILEASTLSALSRDLEQLGKKGNTSAACKQASELIGELEKFVAFLEE